MNFLKRILAWFKGPRADYNLRTYSPDRSYLRGNNESVRFDLSPWDRMEAMRRARFFEKCNPLIQGMLRVHETYVVGCGLKVSPNTSSPEFNQAAQLAFETWAEDCEISADQSLYTSQSVWARRRFIDGDIGVSLTMNERREPRIQTIEGHLIATPHDYVKDENVIDGARVDMNGRAVSWYCGTETKAGQLKFGRPFSAKKFILIKEAERASQIRGISAIVSSLNEIHDLSDLHVLEMRNAKNNADVANILINEAGEFNADAVRTSRFNESVTLNTGATASESRTEFIQTALGGKSIALKRGEDFKQFRTENPSAATRDYWKLKTELACIGADIPYGLIFPNSLQGTIARGMFDTAAATFSAQSDVIASATLKVYWYWLDWAVKSIPELRALKPADYQEATVSRPRAVNVDIGYNANAEETALANGTSNFDLYYAPRGKDWRVELRKKAEQAKYIRDLAVEYGVDVSEISQTQQDKPERFETQDQNAAAQSENPMPEAPEKEKEEVES